MERRGLFVYDDTPDFALVAQQDGCLLAVRSYGDAGLNFDELKRGDSGFRLLAAQDGQIDVHAGSTLDKVEERCYVSEGRWLQYGLAGALNTCACVYESVALARPHRRLVDQFRQSDDYPCGGIFGMVLSEQSFRELGDVGGGTPSISDGRILNNDVLRRM